MIGQVHKINEPDVHYIHHTVIFNVETLDITYMSQRIGENSSNLSI